MEALPKWSSLDLVRFEELLNWFPVMVWKLYGVEPLCACAVIGFGHEVEIWVFAEELLVPICNFLFFGKESWELFELGNADGGKKIDKAVVVAYFVMYEFDGVNFCSGREVFCVFGEVWVVGGDHAAAAGCDEFIAVETKCCHVTD